MSDGIPQDWSDFTSAGGDLADNTSGQITPQLLRNLAATVVDSFDDVYDTITSEAGSLQSQIDGHDTTLGTHASEIGALETAMADVIVASTLETFITAFLNAATLSDAQNALLVEPGVDVQAHSAVLDELVAGLGGLVADAIPYRQADGDFDAVTIGSGLSLTTGTLAASTALQTLASAQTALSTLAAIQSVLSTLAAGTRTMSGRLTLTTGVAITTSDVSGASTIYFTPYNGNLISIYDGTSWIAYTFSELSLALSGLTSGKLYDVYVYRNSGTTKIDLSPAWTNDTTRSSATTILNGIVVNNAQFTGVITGDTVAANRGTLVGTIRTTGTTTTADTVTQRLVCNELNPVPKHLYRYDATTHTYSATTIRGWNGASTHTLEWIASSQSRSPLLTLEGAFGPPGTGSQGARLGVGTATTTQAMALEMGAQVILGSGFGLPTAAPAAGYVIYYVTESATGSGNTSFYHYDVRGQVWV